ncbi:Fe-S cluster assembly protein SufB [Pseudoleptotrichia goodfellowii]|uniref:FeS assembly protein SufB n=1 Tax=Pseudoleptotrichia goodfellowii F0264 TaxID=596323 RepID=D0GJP7_9FUSO|nr:Fe-S cluster assembly protein SufB [Pseudoleptotrichia goodfellowii]EEY35694.1 FeS assembly protein SufB [Pseudoleptotrichia goodfellowii F0264]
MEESRNKTYVADIERGVYDIKDEMHHKYTTGKGLTEEIIRKISGKKNEPEWMLELRLKALEVFNSKPMPTWGADLSDLDINQIIHYLEPDSKIMSDNWDDVPDYIRATFDRLGIPEAEKQSLAGVGAQYDSEVVYHSLHKELEEQGVVYTDIETALHTHEDIVKEYFMKVIKMTDHKFAALHAAVWSGGSFVYVPKGVKVNQPLQSYFRLNAAEAGQFEHTLIIVEEGADLHFIEGCSAPKYRRNALHAGAVELIVRKGARLRYSTIENWSRNLYNLNTKRALIDEDGVMEWVSGSFGSRATMLYPGTILRGERARCEFTGVTFASTGQYLDTGCKIVHAAPYTTSTVHSKSISKNGGNAFYRGFLHIAKNAHGCKSTVECESLMLDNESHSDTIPIIEINNDSVDIGHEAKIGRISDEAIFYLMSRGISKDEAKAMIVRGFVEPISKELPLEYAVELNKLIELELEGTIG